MNDRLHYLTNGPTRAVARHCRRGFCAALVVVLASGFSVAPQEFSSWSTPINLGPSINTASNELHPAISADGLSLFFSSGRPGASAEVTYGLLNGLIAMPIGNRRRTWGRASAPLEMNSGSSFRRTLTC